MLQIMVKIEKIMSTTHTAAAADEECGVDSPEKCERLALAQEKLAWFFGSLDEPDTDVLVISLGFVDVVLGSQSDTSFTTTGFDLVFGGTPSSQ